MSFVQPILPGGIGGGGESNIIGGLGGLIADSSWDYDPYQEQTAYADPVTEFYFEPWVDIPPSTFFPPSSGGYDHSLTVHYPSVMGTGDLIVALVITSSVANDYYTIEFEPEPQPFTTQYDTHFDDGAPTLDPSYDGYLDCDTAFPPLPPDDAIFEFSYDPWNEIAAFAWVPEIDTDFANPLDWSWPDPDAFAYSFDPDQILDRDLTEAAHDFPTGDQLDVSVPDPDTYEYEFDYLRFEEISPADIVWEYDDYQVDTSYPDPDSYDYSWEPWTFIELEPLDVEFPTGDQQEWADPLPDAYDYSFETWTAIPADVGDVAFEFDRYQVDCSDPLPDAFVYTHEVWISIPVDVSDIAFDFPTGDQLSDNPPYPDLFDYTFDTYDQISIHFPSTTTSPCNAGNIVFLYDAETPIASVGVTSAGTASLSPGNGALGTTSMRVVTPADYFVSPLIPESKTWYVDADFRANQRPNDPGGNLVGLHIQHQLDGGTYQVGWYLRGDLRIGLLRNNTEIATSAFTIDIGTYYNVCFTATIDNAVGRAVVALSTAGGYSTYIDFSGDTQASPVDQGNYIAWGHLQPFGSSTSHDFDNVSITNTNTPFLPDPGTATGLIATEIVGHMAALGINPGGGSGYLRTQFPIDPAEFDGGLAYFYEGVILNPGPEDSLNRLLDSANATEGLLTATPSDWQRFRTPISPLTDDTYLLMDPTSVTGGTPIINEGRIIIDQIAGTKQTVYFPFLASTAGLSTAIDADISSGDIDRSGNHLASGNYRDWFVPSGLSYFKYVAAEWDHVSFFRYQALISGAFSAAYSIIYNVATGVEIPESLASNLTYGLATPVVCSREFSASLLTDGIYGIKVRSDHASRNAYIYGAGLDVVLNPANKSNVYWRYGKGDAQAAPFSYITSSRFLLNKEAYSAFSGFIETTALSLAGGYVTLTGDGIEDVGTNFTVQTYALDIHTAETVYRSVDISSYVTSGNRYIYTPAVAAATIRAIFFVAQSQSINEIFAGVCVCPGPVAETILRSTVELETTMLECRVTAIGTMMETIVDVPKC